MIWAEQGLGFIKTVLPSNPTLNNRLNQLMDELYQRFNKTFSLDLCFWIFFHWFFSSSFSLNSMKITGFLLKQQDVQAGQRRVIYSSEGLWMSVQLRDQRRVREDNFWAASASAAWCPFLSLKLSPANHKWLWEEAGTHTNCGCNVPSTKEVRKQAGASQVTE